MYCTAECSIYHDSPSLLAVGFMLTFTLSPVLIVSIPTIFSKPLNVPLMTAPSLYAIYPSPNGLLSLN